MELVKKEQEEKLYRKTFIPKKAEADAIEQFGLTDTANDVGVDKVEDDNPRKKELDNSHGAKVDKNASRRDIAE